jgi:hypothetical protein
VPRLALPGMTTPARWAMTLLNTIATLGVVLYVLRRTGTAPFWRLFAPIYAAVFAAQLGGILPQFFRATLALADLGPQAPLALVGAMVVVVPVLAIAVFTMIALFRLGDWIGPTRRPLGLRERQLSLPL